MDDDETPGASDSSGTADVAERAEEGDLVGRVRRLIATEELSPGERLGTERGLADTLGVSRSRLRAALDELEAADVLRRTMGRAGGVFVADGRIERHLNTIQSVPDLLRQQGLTARTEVLLSALTRPSAAERRALALGEGEHVLRIRRRRDAAGIPLSLDTMSLPARLLPGLRAEELTGSVYALLRERYGIEVLRADESMEVQPADAETAALLAVAEGAPLLAIRRLGFDAEERPVEFSRDLFRADRTRVTLRRYGARWKRATDRP